MPDDAARPLTAQQKKFAELYAAHPDGTKAAIGAGYSARTAASQASQLLNNPKVAAYLAALTEPAQNTRIATAQERQEWWTRVMYGDIQVESYDMFGNMFMKRPGMADRLKASELLGKAQADFKGEVEQAKPSIVINMPQRPMTEAEIEEARERTRFGD